MHVDHMRDVLEIRGGGGGYSCSSNYILEAVKCQNVRIIYLVL